MRLDGQVHRDVWPHGNRRDHVVNQCGLALVAFAITCGLTWDLLRGTRGLIAGVSVGVASAVGLLVRAMRVDLPHLTVDDTHLHCAWRRRPSQSLRLDAITRITSQWVPHTDSVITFRTRDGGEIEMRLCEQTKEFLAAVGCALAPFRHQIHDVSPRTSKILSWEQA